MSEPELTPEERLSEEERKKRALGLTQEIADRYDPARLSKLVVGQAGRGERLDMTLAGEMERRIGARFSDVRIFRGAFAEAVTRAHRADAVTVANTGMILVREGPRSDPKTALGKALIAHELTHVAQAQRGLHFALEGGESQGAAHEREAESVESQVHAEESGATQQAQQEKLDPQEVVDRMVEMWQEKERLHRDRTGEAYRR